MKKWLVAICLTICLLGLTACGQEESVTYLSNTDALTLGTSAQQLLSSVVSQGMEEDYIAQVSASGENGQVYRSAFESWSKAAPDLGEFLGMGDVVSNQVELDAIGYPASGTMEVGILGSNHDGVIEIVFKKGEINAITTNVKYTFGENMEKAALNTLLGMGTVFIVLILISFIISAFTLIPKIQKWFSKKDSDSPVTKAVDQTIAQIIEKEELSDDTELVAVIAAAIAAYEGTSTDGFVVRSIRRSR